MHYLERLFSVNLHALVDYTSCLFTLLRLTQLIERPISVFTLFLWREILELIDSFELVKILATGLVRII